MITKEQWYFWVNIILIFGLASLLFNNKNITLFILIGGLMALILGNSITTELYIQPEIIEESIEEGITPLLPITRPILLENNYPELLKYNQNINDHRNSLQESLMSKRNVEAHIKRFYPTS